MGKTKLKWNTNLLIKRLEDEGFLSFMIKQCVLLDEVLYVHPSTIKAYQEQLPNPKYIFVFKERVLNEWSSDYHVLRKKKLTKGIIKILNKYGVLD